MIDSFTLDESKFSGSTSLVIREIKRRGWRSYSVREGSSHLFIDRGDGKLVHILSSTPPQQGYADGVLSNNKFLTNMLLEQAGISQLPFDIIGPDDDEKLNKFLANHERIVIKPVDGSHGNGIRVGVTGLSATKQAIAYAKQYTNSSSVLIQKQFEDDAPFDLRLLCMQGKFVAAIHRKPARVFGNGINTVSELIEIENAAPHRGLAYMKKYALIDSNRSRQYLGSGIDAIPDARTEIRVMDVANYGAGGELIDVTDQIPRWMRREAEHASNTLKILVAGVDYLTSTLPSPKTQQSDIASTIIEVNKAPALMIHDEPHIGKSRNTVKLFIEMIAQS